MKKIFIFSLLITMSLFGFAQKDWFGFNRYKADNESIIASKAFPEVVFIGNSITDNWAMFHPKFFSENDFCGRGISGQTSAQMLVRFTADVVNLQPKAVVIMAGTNDVAHNDYWVEPERVVENIVAMCDLAKAHGIVPIICSIPPCSEFPWKKEILNPGQTILELNKILKDYANANQIVYIDFHTAFADEKLGLPKSFGNDGCHPNPDTYYIMEELVLGAIREVLK